MNPKNEQLFTQTFEANRLTQILFFFVRKFEMSKIANIGKLKGHTVFITGASRGIGLAIGKKCAADGYVFL